MLPRAIETRKLGQICIFLANKKKDILGRKELTALAEVDIQIEQSELFRILGSNSVSNQY